MESITLLIGSIAATCTTLAFLPQALYIIRTRNTRDVSAGMYCLMTIGVCFWLAYGILLGEAPMIIANTVTLMLTSVILILKCRDLYRTRV